MTWRNFTFSKLIGWFCRRDFCKTFPMEIECVLVSFSNCYLCSLPWPTSRWYTYREWLNLHDTFRFRFGWDGFSPGEYWIVYTTISDSVCLIGCCVCPNSRRFVQTVTHILCVCFILLCFILAFVFFVSNRPGAFIMNQMKFHFVPRLSIYPFCFGITITIQMSWNCEVNRRHTHTASGSSVNVMWTNVWAPSVHRQTPF